MVRESANQITWLDDNGYCKGMQCTKCKAFPCHPDIPVSQFSCKYCYCCMYQYKKCLGNPKWIDINGKTIKDCSECSYPHDIRNVDNIEKFLMEADICEDSFW